VPANEVEHLLSSDEGRADVLREEEMFKSLGVSGVPAFFFNGESSFSGAAPASMLAEAIQQVLPSR
jgi:predicted DsbA family dithiol-disulfide isomerase